MRTSPPPTPAERRTARRQCIIPTCRSAPDSRVVIRADSLIDGETEVVLTTPHRTCPDHRPPDSDAREWLEYVLRPAERAIVEAYLETVLPDGYALRVSWTHAS